MGTKNGYKIRVRSDNTPALLRPHMSHQGVSSLARSCTAKLLKAVGFRNSAAGLRRPACSETGGLVSEGSRGSAAGGEVLVDEFDGLGVVAAVAAERAAERVV
jgi:hypothetical protein